MYVELVDEQDARDAIAEFLHTKRQAAAADYQPHDLHRHDHQGRCCCRHPQHIRVQLDLPLRQLTRESLRYFFDCIRSSSSDLSSSTTEVELYMTSSRRLPTRVEELAFILENAPPTLQDLEIDGVTLEGTNIELLARALSSQQQIRNICLYEVQHVDGMNVDLGPVAVAFTSLPLLESLELYHVRFSKQSTLNRKSLALIAGSSKAKSLEIMLPHCHGSGGGGVMTSAGQQHHYEELQETGLAITEALRNNSLLERFYMVTRLTRTESFMFDNSVVKSLARALQQQEGGHDSSNSTTCRSKLRKLELNVRGDIDLVPLAEALKTNTTLQSLSLCWDITTNSILPMTHDDNFSDDYGGRSVNKNICALREVLRDHNFTLQKLDITLKKDQHNDGSRFEKQFFDPELELYLRLNRCGRQSLLSRGGQQLERMSGSSSSATPEDWIRILSKCNNDVSACMYLLSMNPPLCYEFGDRHGSHRHQSCSKETIVRASPKRRIDDCSNIMDKSSNPRPHKRQCQTDSD